jgi:CubicO group peptidase (beta-lactamase class C family)
MTDGLEWNELSYPYNDSRNSYNKWVGEDDRIKYVFERPARAEPGTQFVYNSGISVILGEILHRATGKNAITFGQEKLFAPLGITDFHWGTVYSVGEYLVNTGGGLRLRPRDMAKFGLLYLNNGNYKGNQIVSEEWVTESLKPHIEVGDPTHYGYQWWEIRYDRYPQPDVHETQYIHTAIGYGGQYILIVPVNNLIVVLTGDNADDGINFWDIMFNHILEAVVG